MSLLHLLHTVEWQVQFMLQREKLSYAKYRKGVAQRYMLEKSFLFYIDRLKTKWL